MKDNIIESKAESILINYNLLNAPINLEIVAEKLKATVNYTELDDDISGFIVNKDGVNIIGINKEHPNVRKRFTLAHELGHLYLNHTESKPLFIDSYKGSKLFRKSNPNIKDYKLERDANYFAAALLMPKKLISNEMMNFSDFLDYSAKVYELSNTFQVSEQAMDYRLKTLGYYDYGF